jgi:transposase
MDGSITWVGIDAHKKTLVTAVLHPGKREPEEFTVDNDERSIRRLVRRLRREAPGEIRVCYEAGPCGYVLQRRLEGAGGIVCEVIAPSLIPRKPGERIKTDRRDARKLADLYRAGVLTAVHPPTPEEESVRDLCRCREDIRVDLGRCRHRLIKFLVRRGYVFNSTSRLWSRRHRDWLAALTFESETDRVIVAEYKLAIEQAERRLKALDAELEKAAQLPIYRDHVAWLRCFHGVDTTVAMIFVAELHGVERFKSPRELAAYLGLVPRVHASGDSEHRGGITKTGNSHIRRALVQAAWQYRRFTGTVGPKLRARREGQPEHILTIADEAQRRLTARFRRLAARGKMANKIVIAIARELVGFLWAALRAEQPARHGARTPTQTEGAGASAVPRSAPRIRPLKKISRTEVGQRRQARKEKRAV